jgi:protein tyrosine/serine phosphatase
MRRIWTASCLAAALSACAAHERMQPVAPSSPTVALADLQSESGPPRFGVVHERLYRGGQPTAEHMRMLHALGVTKVIDLRRERLDLVYAERAAARELGMEFVELPFYGIFGTDPEFLQRVVAEMADAGGGAVYVHCGDGRDRTSLAVSLYRVMVERWHPDEAWEREAIGYGFRARRLNREIELAFRENVLEHSARTETAAAAAPRTREIASVVGGGSQTAIAKAPVEAGAQTAVRDDGDDGGGPAVGAVLEPPDGGGGPDAGAALDGLGGLMQRDPPR